MTSLARSAANALAFNNSRRPDVTGNLIDSPQQLFNIGWGWHPAAHQHFAVDCQPRGGHHPESHNLIDVGDFFQVILIFFFGVKAKFSVKNYSFPRPKEALCSSACCSRMVSTQLKKFRTQGTRSR